MGGLTWDSLLRAPWWGGGMGKVTRGKHWPSVLQSCGGRAVGGVEVPVQTPACPRLGAAWGRAHAPQVSLSSVRVTVFHHCDSAPEPTPWEWWQEGQIGVSEPWRKAGTGSELVLGRHPTYQQGWAVDQMQVVVKGLLLLLPGGWGPRCWDHLPQFQPLKVMVPGN